MKSLLVIFLYFTLIMNFCCVEATRESKTEKQTDTTKQQSPSNDSKNSKKLVDNLGEYSELIPLEIKDSFNKNVYEKYGIDFSGNCYSCDLAKIRINKKHFDIINICDENIFSRIENFSYLINKSSLNIKTTDSEFIFIKIDDAPIYKLTLKGNQIHQKNKRLAIYFTHRKQLTKFKEHNCGEFQG